MNVGQISIINKVFHVRCLCEDSWPWFDSPLKWKFWVFKNDDFRLDFLKENLEIFFWVFQSTYKGGSKLKNRAACTQYARAHNASACMNAYFSIKTQKNISQFSKKKFNWKSSFLKTQNFHLRGDLSRTFLQGGRGKFQNWAKRFF